MNSYFSHRRFGQLVLLGLGGASIIGTTSACAEESKKSDQDNNSETTQKQLHEDNSESMTLVLAAPSVHDSYYKPVFNKIVDFHIDYARKIKEAKLDSVHIHC